MKIDTSNKATFKSKDKVSKSKSSKANDKNIPEKTSAKILASDSITKEPSKELIGHQKAVREIAYSEKHKILVSCGFDFAVFVWNPYYAKYIIKLEGHEHPLVGVNIPKNLPCFIT